MEIVKTSLAGCFLITPSIYPDARGRFVKTFHAPQFAEQGLRADWAEEFYTVSKTGVVRGLHFQRPPHDHVKAVTCLTGEIFDVVVDLRRGSPTFGQAASFRLSGTNGQILWIPQGLAHGFCTLRDDTIVSYKTSTVHAPSHDGGILWSSIGVTWPVESPILSERDGRFPALAEFESPFIYAAPASGLPPGGQP